MNRPFADYDSPRIRRREVTARLHEEHEGKAGIFKEKLEKLSEVAIGQTKKM